MANRLEEEFPPTCWDPTPPVGRRELDPDLVGRCLARGRRLQSRTLRRGGTVVAVRVTNVALALVGQVVRLLAAPRLAAPGMGGFAAPRLTAPAA
jgi:hypothetical protein